MVRPAKKNVSDAWPCQYKGWNKPGLADTRIPVTWDL